MKAEGRCGEKEELELIRSAQNGSEEAAERLLLIHHRMICLLAKRLSANERILEELIQAGRIGLLCAIKRFRPDSKNCLLTYAVPWILGEMKSVLRSQESLHGLTDRIEEETCTTENCIDFSRMDLRFALERLEDDERLLIFLRFYRDKTQKETAFLLHKSQSQISKLEKRTLDRLHEMLS